MKALISEINEKLRDILLFLEGDKNEVELQLSEVQEKIDSKIDEAKTYKTDIDYAKEKIKSFEDEIEGYEDDLKDLTERFSNKDLNAILETGNKEINLKIANCQKDIAKQREKISELTEKARLIKDLLINLKKDKEAKRAKLDNLTDALNYYQAEFNKIIEFSEENPESLVVYEEVSKEKEAEEEYVVDYSYLKNEPIVDDKPIFDAIENIEKETEEESSSEGVLVKEEKEVEIEEEPIKEEKSEESSKSGSMFLLDEFGDFSASLDEEEPIEEKEVEEEQQDITSLFEHDKTMNLDFKTLNDSIDKEYENIFGSSEEIALDGNTLESNEEENNLFNLGNGMAFDYDEDDPFKLTEEDVLGVDYLSKESSNEESSKLDEFLKTNNLEASRFSSEDLNKLDANFNLVSYTKTLDILRKNNIRMENIYNAANIFEVNHLELESIINKLLLAGQTTLNISYVLSSLPFINSLDLADVIESYGQSVKDANITDLIIKAKHLKDIGGGAR